MIFHLPLTMVIAAKAVLLQIVRSALVILAAIKLLAALDGGTLAGGEDGRAAAAMTAPRMRWRRRCSSLYWGVAVLGNVAAVATCGGVGTWYFERAAFERGACCCKPAADSLGRALTSSFGSICAGSLLVAIVQAVGSLLRWIELQAQQEGNLVFVLLACCLRCVFGLVEQCLEMFNEWAYVYVALYGTGFATAGRAVWRLVHAQGLTHIATGLVADTVLGYGVALTTVAGTVAGSAASRRGGGRRGRRAADAIAAAVSAVLSLALGATCLSPMRAAIRTLLVCFAEAPGGLQLPSLHCTMLSRHCSSRRLPRTPAGAAAAAAAAACRPRWGAVAHGGYQLVARESARALQGCEACRRRVACVRRGHRRCGHTVGRLLYVECVGGCGVVVMGWGWWQFCP